MTQPGMYRSRVTFQRADSSGEWKDYITVSCYINGMSGDEFYIANAGYEASLAVNIFCRYQPALMRITPMQYRAVSNGIIYELTSPADDIMYSHREIKFRGVRVYTDTEGGGGL